MRLLYLDENGRIKVTEDKQHDEPYCILSHTWDGSNEVTYQDITGGVNNGKFGWEKLRFIARRAKEEGLKYFWVDTCCIDKRNDAETATAIRSMFQWYATAKVCYVFLTDIAVNKRDHDGERLWRDQFRNCRWFTRGWTLQEMLAPTSLKFYAGEIYLGDKSSLCDLLHEITGIDRAALEGERLYSFSHHARLQWATKRETTVPEDMAYCLIGICGVSMGPRYGNGYVQERQRLEGKIIKRYGTSAFEDWTRNVSTAASTREVMLERLKFDVMDTRKQTIQKAVSKTCGWLLEHPSFLLWRQPKRQHHGFFWIKGKPGTGKSVLMKFIDTCVSKEKKDGQICISFYFNARGHILEKSFIGLYRSMLLQLLLALPDLQHLLDKASTGFQDSVESLQSLFKDACHRLGQRQLYCFIDALDECKEEDVSQMIEFFQDLGQFAADNNTSILTCFASRHYPIIDVPRSIQLVLEETAHHSGDIERYTREKLRLNNPKQAEDIANRILLKANGIFLWVVLVVEILKKEYVNGRIHAVKRKLETIPQGLNELFTSIIQQDRENLVECALCLKWMLYAKRPLALTEFYFAMMVSLGEGGEWIQDMVDEKQMLRYLLSSSKGLAELTKGGMQSVQFIHESVRDFLMKEGGFEHILDGKLVSEAQIHDELKRICLRGLQDGNACRSQMGLSHDTQDSRLKDWKPSVSEGKRDLINHRFPFLGYANAFILHHSNEAESGAAESGVAQYNFLRDFDLYDWLVKANLLQKYNTGLYKWPCDIVYLCAERNLANLLRILVQNAYLLTEGNVQRCATPLFAAFANKCTNAARLILSETGADVDAPGVSYNSALHAATLNSHPEIIKLLIDNGADINVQNGHDSVLYTACLLGRKEIVQLLLDKGAEVNAGGGSYGNALQAASYKGREKIVRLLLDKGAGVNAKGGIFGNALQAASYNAWEKIVRLLLDEGAEVNAEGGRYGNALQAASRNGREKIVRLLLDKGAEVNAEGGRYGNALQAASYKGREKIVRLLLDKGAEVNAEGGFYGNALQAALVGGHISTIDLLVSRGARCDWQSLLVLCDGSAAKADSLLRRNVRLAHNQTQDRYPCDFT